MKKENLLHKNWKEGNEPLGKHPEWFDIGDLRDFWSLLDVLIIDICCEFVSGLMKMSIKNALHVSSWNHKIQAKNVIPLILYERWANIWQQFITITSQVRDWDDIQGVVCSSYVMECVHCVV